MGTIDTQKSTGPTQEASIASELEVNQGAKFNIYEKNLLISLELDHDNTGSRIESMALKEGFRKQDHRHVTIVGGSTKRLLKQALTKLPKEEQRQMMIEIKKLLTSLDWSFVPIEIYKIEKIGTFGDSEIPEYRESYINVIDMPAVTAFYDGLKLLLNTDFPLPVPHITLFTKGETENPRYYGIPISSIDDFHQMNPRKLEHIPAHHE